MEVKSQSAQVCYVRQLPHRGQVTHPGWRS